MRTAICTFFILNSYLLAGYNYQTGVYSDSTLIFIFLIGISSYYAFSLKNSYGVFVSIFWLAEIFLFVKSPVIIIIELTVLIVSSFKGRQKFLKIGGIDLIKAFNNEDDFLIKPKSVEQKNVDYGERNKDLLKLWQSGEISQEEFARQRTLRFYIKWEKDRNTYELNKDLLELYEKGDISRHEYMERLKERKKSQV